MTTTKSESQSIKNLPDYPAVEKLAAALWQQENAYHGAAVLVGAGFSRSGATTGDVGRKLPLWSDLSATLALELGADKYSDPLRLAQEYLAYFGKQTLHDLVKKEINDAAWTPGELHKSLLELPWSEVLTTNWDTLLERASMEVHQPVYNLVSKQEDLSSARSPRIVKLHGTVKVTEELVFTQEDYRKYPQRYAAFVNFSRQVFIENELCLLGFSGDDPNFLQWAGWVRDQLTTSTRRIYLVGALNLTAARRKYLEGLNVSPIDLSKLVAEYDDVDEKHARALEVFLLEMKSLKPKPARDWVPTPLHRTMLTSQELDATQNPVHAAVLLEQQLSILEADRKSYPGWLVCPASIRMQLQNQINDPYPTAENISALAPDGRAKLLYEIAWRRGTAYEMIHPWMVKELLTICDPAIPCILSKKQQMEVASLLLKNTKWFDDSESRLTEATTTAILEKNVSHWHESPDELTYHRAIVTRDNFDYAGLTKLVDKISTKNGLWKLRKASLLGELGRFAEGEACIASAHADLLRQYRNDRGSIYLLSRLAWAGWLARYTAMFSADKKFETYSSRYTEQQCDPWDDIDQLRRQISDELDRQRKNNEIEPSFAPGTYKDNSNTVTFNKELQSILLLNGLCTDVGMPLRWRNTSFLVEHASRLIELDEVDGLHRLALAIRAASSDTSDVLKKAFSRTQIACLSGSEANHLLARCIDAIAHWSSTLSAQNDERNDHAIGRLRVFVEVLARLSVRATPEQALGIFRLATELGKKPAFHHWWLFDALSHLLEYALESIPVSRHYEVLLDALSFPLPTEINIGDHGDWPNPAIKLPGNRSPSTFLDRRIDEIIERITPCSPKSGSALLRLLPLLEHEFLTYGEHQKITEKIWGASPGNPTLPETGLVRYVVLVLPSYDVNRTRDLVRTHLFDADDAKLFDPSLLSDIAGAALAEKVKEMPANEQALNYFNRLVMWRPRQNENDLFGLSTYKEKQTRELIGKVLAHSVVPSLSSDALTDENLEKLLSFHREVGSQETVMAFVYFAVADQRFDYRAEDAIRKGLQHKDSNNVAYASYALLKWTDLSGQSVTAKLISTLIYMIGSSRSVGLPAMLWTANQMYNKSHLSERDVDELVRTLPVIFDEASYRNVLHASRDAVSISLLRAACVRLARDLIEASKIQDEALLRVLEEARNDPLPEVRFATKTKIG